jgi:hypothetical protein
MNHRSESGTQETRLGPWASVIAMILITASAVLGLSFKMAFWLRHDVSTEAQPELDSLLRLLANSYVAFWIASVLAACWAVGRGERRGGIIALVLCALFVVAELSMM